MKQFLELYRTILSEGEWQDNRTGIRTIAISGAMMKYDLSQGFPATTTRKLPFKTFTGEALGFLRGYTNAADFRAMGCKVWDQNANENKQWLANPFRTGHDDLGPIYGEQWRNWKGYRVLAENHPALQQTLAAGWEVVGKVDDGLLLYKRIDQVRDCLDKLIHDPTSRRILFHGWNPAVLDEIALPACHIAYCLNANVAKRELSMTLWQRSADTPLGVCGNLTGASIILSLMARLTGFTPRHLTWFGSDVHIYENQLDMVNEQLKREPFAPPKLVISDRIPEYAKTGKYEPEWLEKAEVSDFRLEGYEHHPALTAPMAV